MNRKNFLQNIDLGTSGIIVAPQLIAVQTKKNEIL